MAVASLACSAAGLWPCNKKDAHIVVRLRKTSSLSLVSRRPPCRPALKHRRGACYTVRACSQGSTTAPPPPLDTKKEAHQQQGAARPAAQYHPDVWVDYFIHSVSPPPQSHHAWMQQRAEEVKEQVKRMLGDAAAAAAAAAGHGHHDLETQMELVDALQRLGLAYHFEKEIDQVLGRLQDNALHENDDLHVVALRFRLLRQEGHHVSSDVFNKFKDAHGRFRTSLSSDLKGLVSLYEAAYLATHADVALEGAIPFCSSQLEPMLNRLHPHLAAEVARALETPLIRRIKRVETRRYISFYEGAEGRNDLVLELAKLDFNLLQSLHQKEIKTLALWWKELGLIKELGYARDRLVECFFVALGVYYEPQFSRGRLMLTKFLMLATLMDDTYDSYGTLDELQLFTDVIQRWDVDAVHSLPRYMQIYFVALDNALKQFEEELVDEQKSFRVAHLREEVKIAAKTYLVEAKWSNTGYVPTLEEHLKISLITSSNGIFTCASFLGMGDEATREAFDWVRSFPKIVEASAIIGRLMDDISTYEFEQERPHVASSVQCYMKEFGVSKEEACRRLRDMVEDAWKVQNQECVKPTVVPLRLLMSTFNLSRVIELYYNSADGFTHSSNATKDLLKQIFVKPIPM